MLPLSPHTRRRCLSLVLAMSTGALFLLSAAAAPAVTSHLRCGSRIISVGDSSRDVRKKCGPPNAVDTWEEAAQGYVSQFYDYAQERYRLPRLVKGPIHMQRWTYDFGANRLVEYLTFENGRLIGIVSGERGKP